MTVEYLIKQLEQFNKNFDVRLKVEPKGPNKPYYLTNIELVKDKNTPTLILQVFYPFRTLTGDED